MHNQPHADTPIVLDQSGIPAQAGINTPAIQLAILREWIGQYQGGSFSETVATKVCTLLVTGSEPLDLAAVQADLRRVVEILQAFGGTLACLDAQVNGIADE
jgi:hypothetical protein